MKCLGAPLNMKAVALFCLAAASGSQACVKPTISGHLQEKPAATDNSRASEKDKIRKELMTILQLFADEQVAKEFAKKAETLNLPSLSVEEYRRLLAEQLPKSLKETGLDAGLATTLVARASKVLTTSVSPEAQGDLENRARESLQQEYAELKSIDPAKLQKVWSEPDSPEAKKIVQDVLLGKQPPAQGTTEGGQPIGEAQPLGEPQTLSELRFENLDATTPAAQKPIDGFPELSLRDASGNLTRVTVSVSLSAHRKSDCSDAPLGTSGFQLKTRSRTSIDGQVLNFQGLMFTEAGSFHLQAKALSSEGLSISSCSGAITVNASTGPSIMHTLNRIPTALRFAPGYPQAGTVDTPLSGGFKVEVTDAQGLLANQNVVPVTLSVFRGADCSGEEMTEGWQTPARVVFSFGASATFPEVVFSQPGTYALRATAPGLSGVCASPVVVQPQSAVRVDISGIPTSILNGRRWGSAITLTVRNVSGDRVPTTGALSLSAHATGSCTGSPITGMVGNSAEGTTGQVVLSNVTLSGSNLPAQIWVLATARSLFSECRGPIVVASPVPVGVRFVAAPPVSIEAHADSTEPVRVAIVDATGSVIRHQPGSVTLSLHREDDCASVVSDGLECSGLNCTSPLDQETGQATFTGMKLHSIGSRFLKAEVAGLGTACAGPIDVLASGIVASLSGTPASPTNAPALNITVGGADVAEYKHILLSGDTTCSGRQTAFDAIATFTSASTAISDALVSEGSHTLCVIGKSASGEIQLWPTALTFVRDASFGGLTLTGAPVSGTQESFSYINVTGVDVSSYRWSLQTGTGCAGATYGAWTTASTPLVAPLLPGTQTFCVLGRDAAGNEQNPASPTAHTFAAASRFPPDGMVLVETVSDTALRVFAPEVLAGTPFALVYQAGSTPPGPGCASGLPVPGASTGGEVILTGLSPATVYSFRACVSSTSGVVGSGKTFVTGEINPLNTLCDSGDRDTACTISSTKNVLRPGVNFVVRGDLTLASGSLLGPSPGHEKSAFNLYVGGKLTIEGTLRGNLSDVRAHEIGITSTGLVTAKGLGHEVSNGNGGGPAVGRWNGATGQGGGHAGSGGYGYGGVGQIANAYGTAFSPTTRGSSGGCPLTSPAPCAGGGAIRLQSATLFTISPSAVITAEAATLPAGQWGGGAGGSIWITTSSLAGGGEINVRGASNPADTTNTGGNGSGGRIALHYASSTWSGSLLTEGGQALADDQNGPTGTLAVVAGGVRRLTFDGKASSADFEPTTLDLSQVDPGLPGQHIDAIELINNARVTITDGTPVLSVSDFTVEAGSEINETNRGYPPWSGPAVLGNGVDCVASSLVRVSYADCGMGQIDQWQPYLKEVRLLRPLAPGSGRASPGGGAIWLEVLGDLTINGNVISNSYSDDGSGRPGSGGSIYLKADRIYGTGTIQNMGHSPDATNEPSHGNSVHIEVRENNSTLTINPIIANTDTGVPALSWTVNGYTTTHMKDTMSWSHYALNLTTPGRIDQLTIDAATLYFGEQVLEIGDLIVNSALETRNNVTLTAENVFIYNRIAALANEARIHVKATNMTITSGDFVSVNSAGYSGRSGPAGGTTSFNSCTSSGGHSGPGLIFGSVLSDECLGIPLGASYGDPISPTTFGSAASARDGGGAIHLEVSDTLRIDGYLDARGEDGGAGGAGGSVLIEAGTLTGPTGGAIRASGGSGGSTSAPGSGGRVAIHADDTSGWSGNVFVGGGPYGTVYDLSWRGLRNISERGGTAGTFFNHDRSTGQAVLTVSGRRWTGAGDVAVSRDTCRMGAPTVIDYDDFATFPGQIDVVVEEGACALFLNARAGVFRDISFLDGGLAVADGQGLAGGSLYHYGSAKGVGLASGSGVSGGSGGGGGAGPQAGSANADSPTAPTSAGGGGGCSVNASGNFGGNGGGAIRIFADGNVFVDATSMISANGEDGAACGGGGGGAIWITAQSIVNNGVLSAEGGNGDDASDSYGGGGGRIHLEAPSVSGTGTVSVSGGTGDAGGLGNSGTFAVNGLVQ